jgi:hypothetical protein
MQLSNFRGLFDGNFVRIAINHAPKDLLSLGIIFVFERYFNHNFHKVFISIIWSNAIVKRFLTTLNIVNWLEINFVF